MMKNCEGTDRRLACRQCGQEDHYVKDCTAASLEALRFKEVLLGESSGYRGAKVQAAPSAAPDGDMASASNPEVKSNPPLNSGLAEV